MTSRQHQDWINHGRPDSGLVLPLAQLRDTLRAAGWTVYDWPDDSHLDAQPPEDHTFYSETGWPSTSPKWWRHAIDIMPKSQTNAGASELYDLGNRLYLDRMAGRITWLKYMNVPTIRGLAGLSQARQHRWEPDYQIGPSSDAGHIHISAVTGCETLSSPYNPLVPAGADIQELFMSALSDEQQHDLWVWLASLVDPNTPLTGRTDDRFRFPPALVQIKTELAELQTKIDDLTTAFSAFTKASTPTGDVTVSGTLHVG